MRLRVFHRTGYHYDAPLPYAIQTLRLTPAPYEGLTILHWCVEAEGRHTLPVLFDGLGNVIHCHSIDRPHLEARVTVDGEVETHRADGIVFGAPEPVPPSFFLRSTPLTAVDGAIALFAREAGTGEDNLERLHRLMGVLRERLAYQKGYTDTQTAAAAALERGRGVCQDYAHVFIAAARSLGIPARYVSGYLWTGAGDLAYDATHAWAEAFVEDLGWVGFDAANGICPDEKYIRLAIGLDYWGAAPVRGLRRGTAAEEMQVKVQVERADADQ